MQWEQLSLDGLGFLQSWGTCPRMCSGKICTLIRHLNVTGKLWELDQPLERNTIYICLTKLFFTVLCTLKSCSLHIQEKINISKWEWASDVMNYLHMAPENTASKLTQTWSCYAAMFSKKQAFWLGTWFWHSLIEWTPPPDMLLMVVSCIPTACN